MLLNSTQCGLPLDMRSKSQLTSPSGRKQSICLVSVSSYSTRIWGTQSLIWSTSSHKDFICFKNSFIETQLTYHQSHSSDGYNSVSFSAFAELCKHHHCPISEHFHQPKKKPRGLWLSLPSAACPPIPGNYC